MVAKAAGGANDDMGAGGQGAGLALAVHAADAAGHTSAGVGVEPGQFTLHLHGEFARGCDNKGQGCPCSGEGGFSAE